MKKDFFGEQYDRFKMPWKHTAFKSYFIWIVVVFGGLGIAITIYYEINKLEPNYSSVSESIATTFVALIAASLVDLNLSYNIKNFPSLIINSIACIGVSILLLLFSFNIETAWSLIPAIGGYILSILIWVLANADNEKLADETFYKKMIESANELSKDWE